MTLSGAWRHPSLSAIKVLRCEAWAKECPRFAASKIIKTLLMEAKGYAMAELKARIRAVTRRGSSVPQNGLTVGQLVLNPDNGQLTSGGETTTLPRSEFQILHYLMRHPLFVFSVLPFCLLVSRTLSRGPRPNGIRIFLRFPRSWGSFGPLRNSLPFA